MSLGRITTIAAVTCALAPALVWGQGDRMLGGANAVGGGGDTSRGMLSVDVSGIHSWDDWFYPLNEELFPQVDPNAHIIGLGWDVTITTKPWALLTDVRVLFIGVETANMFSLAPGMGDDFGGTASYSSGGIVDLRPSHFDFHADSMGLFRMHFYQRGDRGDHVGEVDATWASGTITIQYEAVPTPPSMASLALAGLFAIRRHR